MTLEEAKAKLEDVVKEIQADGALSVEGWSDTCITIKQTDGSSVEIKPSELHGLVQPPAPPAPQDPPPHPPEGAPVFTKDSLPADYDETIGGGAWGEFSKSTLTKAIKIQGAFEVITIHGGEPQRCEDGWLALDSEGYPYPIDSSVFDKTFVSVAD